MALCRFYNLFKAIYSAVSNATDKEITEEEFAHIYNAAVSKDYSTKVDILNRIEGIRAIHVEDVKIDEKFLSKDSWFTEMVQANKSSAIMYSEDMNHVGVNIFYDKEYDFYVVDYCSTELVPEGSINRDPLTNLSECIVYPKDLENIYDRIIIIQGKGD